MKEDHIYIHMRHTYKLENSASAYMIGQSH